LSSWVVYYRNFYKHNRKLWVILCNTHSQWEVFCWPIFSSFWKQELSWIKWWSALVLVQEESLRLGLCKMLENNQFVLCLCVDALFTCNFDHSFLLHPNSKFFTPFFFPHYTHMNAFHLPFKFWIH
jgi:hypothetical protein